ncbi:MAG TPA: ABC transporter permease [Micromonospora sp.]
MAVAESAVAAPKAPRVSIWHFVRLQYRMMDYGSRRGWRLALRVLSIVLGFLMGCGGLVLLALPGVFDSVRGGVLTASFTGTVSTLSWLLLPLVFFGVDETLDPARFALLPLRRRTLVIGLLTAALLGVSALSTFLATLGLVVSAGLLGGVVAALVEFVGIAGGVVLGVAASRALASAFANLLRSRRMRDLANVLLAALAALLGPLTLAVMYAIEKANWDQLTLVARVLGWTPLAAPYTAGMDVVEGQIGLGLAKLAITALTIVGLLWWWAHSLESAMYGAVSEGGARGGRTRAGGPVEALFPRAARWLPRDRYGALVARELRYWWRDARRRSSLIAVAVGGVFVPVMVNLGGVRVGASGQAFDAAPALLSSSMIFVGALSAVSLANQFGLDGSAYAAHIIAGVPGKVELRARVVAYSIQVVPLLVLISVVLGLLIREPTWIGIASGSLFAAYGASLAITLFISVLAAYALPETSNPFAVTSGTGMARSMLSFVAVLGGGAASVPMIVATVVLGDLWLWLALPLGLAYGVGAAALGTYLAGDALDRRMPELLQTITPRR